MFRVEHASVAADGETVRLEFRFTCGETTFAPSVKLAGLRAEEVARVSAPTAQRLVRALAIVEAFSYWKAFCSPVIEAALPSADPAETAWWDLFWPKAMGEFFYRNGIDFTAPATAVTTAATPARASEPVPAPGSHDADAPSLVMFSGGKDSLAWPTPFATPPLRPTSSCTTQPGGSVPWLSPWRAAAGSSRSDARCCPNCWP